MTLKSAIATVRKGIPTPLRRSVDSLRPLPDFLIIGAMKAGTTSLHEHLVRHPRIAFGRVKEVQFFSRHYAKGERHYRSHFPIFRRMNSLVGDATPAYLFLPPTPGRIRAMMPNVKMIALLRDPVERAISHYFHEVRGGRESLPIAEAMEAEDKRIDPEIERVTTNGNYVSESLIHFSYKRRGHYLEQIERYWSHFPKEQLLILRSEDFFADPLPPLAEVCCFLNIPNLPDWGILQARNVGGNRQSVPDELRARLREYFAPYNRRLEEALGRKMNWD